MEPYVWLDTSTKLSLSATRLFPASCVPSLNNFVHLEKSVTYNTHFEINLNVLKLNNQQSEQANTRTHTYMHRLHTHTSSCEFDDIW